MMADGRDMSDLFAAVVKNVVSKNVEASVFVGTGLLNSSPIDELGEGAYESGWWCQAKCECRAGHAGIHGNPESGNHHQALSH